MAQPSDPIEVVIGELLTSQHKTLAVAESCTGGLITHRLTNVPGSSSYVIASVIAYAYEAKVAALGVSWDTLNRHGAVSAETVKEMANGVRAKFSSTLGLAVTGIAGPGGGTPDKPVGLTYIGLASGDGVIAQKYVFHGNRIRNKEQSAQAALELLKDHLAGIKAVR